MAGVPFSSTLGVVLPEPPSPYAGLDIHFQTDVALVTTATGAGLPGQHWGASVPPMDCSKRAALISSDPGRHDHGGSKAGSWVAVGLATSGLAWLP